MKEEKFFLDFDSYERRIILNSLNDMKTNLQREGKDSGAVNDLIIRVGYAPVKKFKVIERAERGRCRDETR